MESMLRLQKKKKRLQVEKKIDLFSRQENKKRIICLTSVKAKVFFFQSESLCMNMINSRCICIVCVTFLYTKTSEKKETSKK